ncbi:MAG: hypothetical protein K2H96_10520 [Muribaculaceae bacterium]|nr:hypothetical protein [Muribaculaceae bacterium]
MKKLLASIATVAMAFSAWGADWTYSVDPAEGEVSSLQVVTLAFPNLQEIEINSKDDLSVARNGAAVTGVNVAVEKNNELKFAFSAEQKDPGTYVITIPAGTIGYNAKGEWMEDNPEDILLTWTIVSAADELSFKYKSSLPEDEYLAYFGELTLEFTDVEGIAYSGSGISVKKDGEDLPDVTVSTEANKLTLTLKEALNFVDCKIDVVIAAGALTAVAGDVTASNSQEINIAYTMATPVEYDLSLTISGPKISAEGQIDYNNASVESLFFVCEQKGLVATSGSAANVTIRSEEGDFEASAHLRKSNGLNANYTYFSASFGKEPSYNGTYIVTIDKGAFGTAVWGEDPNYGHSNEKIELRFEIVGGPDRANFSIIPTAVDPAEGTYISGNIISEITLSFEEGVKMKPNASATLAGINSSYRETASFKANPDGGYTVTFASAPTDEGKYLFTVLAGQFGDAGFVSNGIGKGSGPITLTYNLNFSSGIEAVSQEKADATNEIYSIQGTRMNSNEKDLPNGLYIVNGKKTMIRK